MEQTIEILIVDDHQIFRVGLEAILNSMENVSVIGETDNGEDLFKLLRKKEPHIIFMDINLVNESGIELTKKTIARYPDITVCAITSSEVVNDFNAMMEAGASAFLLKNSPKREIEKAVREMANGNGYFSKEFLYLAKKYIGKPRKNASIVLSDRETQILKLICHGYSNQEIADEIDLSVHTIDTHRRNLLSKTQARNTASLVMIAFRDGLVNLDND